MKPLIASEFFSALATSTASALVRLWLVLILFAGTDSTTHVSWFFTTLSVCSVLAGLVAGTIVDRHGALTSMWRVITARIGLSAATIGVMMWVAHGTAPQSGAYLLVTALLGAITACDTVYAPAARSLMQEAATGNALVRAFSWLQFCTLVATMCGPVIAGWGADRSAFVWFMLIEALGLACAGLLLTLVKRAGIDHRPVQKTEPTSFRSDWIVGAKAIGRNRTYRLLFPFAAGEAVGMAGLSLMLLYYVLETLRASSVAYGAVSASMSAGFALGYLIAGRVAAHIRFRWLLAASNLGVAVFVVCASLVSTSWLVCVSVFCMATIQAVVGPPFQAVFVSAIPKDVIGQAYSMFIAVIEGVTALSTPLWGWIARMVNDAEWGIAGLDGYRTALLLVGAIHAVLVIYAALSRRVGAIQTPTE